MRAFRQVHWAGTIENATDVNDYDYTREEFTHLSSTDDDKDTPTTTGESFHCKTIES